MNCKQNVKSIYKILDILYKLYLHECPPPLSCQHVSIWLTPTLPPGMKNQYLAYPHPLPNILMSFLNGPLYVMYKQWGLLFDIFQLFWAFFRFRNEKHKTS